MGNEKIDECRMKQKLVSALLSAKADNEGLTAFKTVLYGEFLEFANSENALSNEAEMILSLQEIERDLELISAYPRLHTKNVVAVGGGFSAGKSEFISSFIRSGIRLPVGVVPTTAIPTYVFHEETEKILGCSGKGGVVELNEIDENFQAKLSHDFIKSFDFNLKEIMPYMMIGSRIDHTHICFVDTPGYNPASVSDGFTHEDVKTARDFLESANALVWLIGADAHGTVSASDLEFLSGLDLEEKPLYIVYNKADLRSPDDLEEILDAIGESLEDEDLAFEGISAYSSVTGEEYLHVGRSLDEFLRDCDVYANKHIEIHRRLKYVHDAYKEATEAKIAEKKEIARRLRSLSFDTYEEGVELDRKPHEAIESLKKLFSTRTEEIDLQRLEEIFGRMKESVDRVFGRSVDFDFDKIEDKRKKRKPFPSSAHGKLPISEHAKNRESGHEETKRLRCADPTGASGRNVGTRESRNGDEERLYPVKEGERYGYMNIRGEWRIEPTFQAADDFAANALAKIQRDGRWGLIDKRGEIDDVDDEKENDDEISVTSYLINDDPHYLKPHMKIWAYTNIENSTFWFMNNGMPMRVEYNPKLVELANGRSGIFIICRYDVTHMDNSDLTNMVEIILKQNKIFENDVKMKILDKLRNISDEILNFNNSNKILRVVYFIDEKELMENSIVKHNGFKVARIYLDLIKDGIDIHAIIEEKNMKKDDRITIEIINTSSAKDRVVTLFGNEYILKSNKNEKIYLEYITLKVKGNGCYKKYPISLDTIYNKPIGYIRGDAEKPKRKKGDPESIEKSLKIIMETVIKSDEIIKKLIDAEVSLQKMYSYIIREEAAKANIGKDDLSNVKDLLKIIKEII